MVSGGSVVERPSPNGKTRVTIWFEFERIDLAIASPLANQPVASDPECSRDHCSCLTSPDIFRQLTVSMQVVVSTITVFRLVDNRMHSWTSRLQIVHWSNYKLKLFANSIVTPCSNHLCCRFEGWTFSFSPQRLISIMSEMRLNEYLDIDSVGHVSEHSSRSNCSMAKSFPKKAELVSGWTYSPLDVVALCWAELQIHALAKNRICTPLALSLALLASN